MKNRSPLPIFAVLVLLASAGLARAADPQRAAALRNEAEAAYQTKDYGKSAELFAAASAEQPGQPSDAYNAACAAALAGKADDAFRHLGEAVARGYDQEPQLAADTDLTALHADPRWEAIARGARQNLEKKLAGVGDRALREEILRMKDVDQEARAKLVHGMDKPDPAVLQAAEEVDRRNTARMKEIVGRHGWPGRRLVGEDGAAAAWLLVQHADRDPEFQVRCLDLMAEAVKKGDASGRNLAYLTDRVLVAQKKPQRYGTQAHTVDGERVPFPIEDEAQVDERRSALGMGTLAEYMKQMEAVYAPKTPVELPASKPADKPLQASRERAGRPSV